MSCISRLSKKEAATHEDDVLLKMTSCRRVPRREGAKDTSPHAAHPYDLSQPSLGMLRLLDDGLGEHGQAKQER